MGRYGEITVDKYLGGLSAASRLYLGKLEITSPPVQRRARDMGRSGEIWGGMGRSGEVRGDMGRSPSARQVPLPAVQLPSLAHLRSFHRGVGKETFSCSFASKTT